MVYKQKFSRAFSPVNLVNAVNPETYTLFISRKTNGHF